MKLLAIGSRLAYIR